MDHGLNGHEFLSMLFQLAPFEALRPTATPEEAAEGPRDIGGRQPMSGCLTNTLLEGASARRTARGMAAVGCVCGNDEGQP